MSYEHRSNVRNNRVPFSFKILSVIVIFLLLSGLFFPRFFPNLAILIVSPFWHHSAIMDPATELQSSTITELQKENDELKNVLHRNASSSPMTLAFIVKKPPFTAYDSYIIDIGKNTNIEAGDRVYAHGNVLLGEIVEKTGSFAKVKLYSSYGEKFEVFIGKNNIQATAMGKGGGAFEITLPKDLKIAENDTVTIPSLSPSVFGIVRGISVDSARAFSTILFSQPINIYEQKWVEIYTK